MNPVRLLLDKLAPLAYRLQGKGWYRQLMRHFGSIRVHEASPQEIYQSWEIIEPGSGEQSIHSNPNVTPYVGYAGKSLAGYMELVRYPDEHPLFHGYWITGLYVRTRFRGLGVGKALVQQAIKRAREENASEIWLLVYNNRIPAVRLYQKLGFTIVSSAEIELMLENERSGAERRILMRRLL